MKHVRNLYLAGCWLFGIACGLGHIAVELGPKPPETAKLTDMLRNFPVSMPGTETNAHALTLGVSLIMGLMLVAYGVANLLILRATAKPHLPELEFQVMNVVFSAAAFGLACTYLFTIPILFTGLATLCFVASLAAARLSRAALG